MRKLYIIDAAGYAYRSYFAIRNMTNDQGESTNSLFGFVRSFLKWIKDFSPEYSIAVFDGKNNAESRTAIYPAYKAHRQTMPPDLLHQIQWAKEFCRLIGISVLDPEGVEADDTIGSIALWAKEHNWHTYICSTDKDLSQLVCPEISLIDTYKDNKILGPEEIKEKFGVPPSLIVDYLALIGDASDNVPGVPGIGPKTAADLLNQAGSLEKLLEHPELIPQKNKQALILNNKDIALISKQLVSLHTEVDFPKEESFFLIKPTLTLDLQAFYEKMKFQSLVRELLEKKPSEELAPENQVPNILVDDLSSFQSMLSELKQETSICITAASSQTNPLNAELIGLCLGVFASSGNKIWYLPFNGSLDQATIKEGLISLFVNEKHHFYSHNIKFCRHILKNAGFPILSVGFDTLLASYLLNSHSRRHTLDELALENFGIVKASLSKLLGKGKAVVSLKEVPLDKMASFYSEEIDYIIRLKNIFQPQIEERGFHELYYSLELPLLTVLAHMEEAGVYLDIHQLKALAVHLKEELSIASKEIFSLAGEEFNLNSPLQISKILFEKLKIPALKGASTGAEVLDELKWNYPIAGKIQEYRILEKLRSTYVEALPMEVNPKTSRIHCTFNQSVAATGRLSCQDPNLQNIPVRSEIGLQIRQAFRPQKEGWSYISADYSQIELRLLAHLSEDPILLDAFFQGADIHTHTASRVFHVEAQDVTREMRAKAKAVNFGILYGQGSYGLSQTIGISQKEAAFFITTYFEKYPNVKTFLESCKDSARLTGKAVTLTGRERLIPEILSKNIQIRNAAERLAVNTPFQGSAADLIKKAMLDIDKAIKAADCSGYMILQIHDELIFEVPDVEIEFFKNLIKDKMENVIDLKVPLLVDVEVGKNWKEC